MTDSVAVQTAYVGLFAEKLEVTVQAAYVGLFATGLEVVVQAAYVGLFDVSTTGRRRQMVSIN